MGSALSVSKLHVLFRLKYLETPQPLKNYFRTAMEKTLTYPNLIICGAPKCGTSSLYFWLAAHPDVGASKAKETFFFADDVNRFNQGCNYLENGLAAYASHFKHIADKRIRFEATAPYIYYKTAIKGISELPETPKLLFILREPAARLHSQYQFERYRTHRVDCSFQDYVKEPDMIAHGNYYHYLKDWLAAFGHEKIKVVQLEEVMANPVKAMHAIADWLNLDGSFWDDFDFTIRNETVFIKRKRLHRISLKLQPLVPHWVQQKLLPFYLKTNSRSKPQIPAQDLELKKQLMASYQPENEKLFAAFPELNPTLWASK